MEADKPNNPDRSIVLQQEAGSGKAGSGSSKDPGDPSRIQEQIARTDASDQKITTFKEQDDDLGCCDLGVACF